MRAANFHNDIQRGLKGEFASVYAMIFHMQGIDKIALSKTINKACPEDFHVFTKQGAEFLVDMKTDWHALKTKNLFFEPVSQLKRTDHLVFPKDSIEDTFSPDFERKKFGAKNICDTIVERLLNGDESGLPKNKEGWGIKDLGHIVGYWAVRTAGKQFASKEQTIRTNLEISEDGMIQDFESLKVNHNQFMSDIGVKEYVLYIIKKDFLLEHVKKHYNRYEARAVYNSSGAYMTLGYLIPLSEINEMDSTQMKRYGWRAE